MHTHAHSSVCQEMCWNKTKQERGTYSDPPRRLPAKWCWIGNGLANKGADIFHTYRWFVQECKRGSKAKTWGFVLVVRYAVVNSCDQKLSLLVSSSQRFWEKPQLEIYLFTKKIQYKGKRVPSKCPKNCFTNELEKLAGESSRHLLVHMSDIKQALNFWSHTFPHGYQFMDCV